MADFEDANSPTWENVIDGQVNMRDAVRRTINYRSPEGKAYMLAEKTATILVRPRGWHLEEKHVLRDGRRVSASLFDWGLYFFHNAKELLARGSGPYFYLPKWRVISRRGCERRVRPRAGRPRRAARQRARHHADRDDPRCI